MKKMIYLLALAATLSLAFSSCGGKDKDTDDEGDVEDMTLVIQPGNLA